MVYTTKLQKYRNTIYQNREINIDGMSHDVYDHTSLFYDFSVDYASVSNMVNYDSTLCMTETQLQ